MANAPTTTPAAADAEKKSAEAAQAAATAREAEQNAADARERAAAEKDRRPPTRIKSDEPGAEAESPITKLKVVDVRIFRNENATIPDRVFAHELPILEVLHTRDGVRVVGEDTVEVYDFDPATELARLERKYGRNQQDVVAAAFGGDPARLAEKAGVSYRGGTTVRKPVASVSTPVKKKPIGKKR